jgi:hypothetical protein
MSKLLACVDWSRPSPSSPRLAACGPVQSNLPFGLDWTEHYPRLGPSGLVESLTFRLEDSMLTAWEIFPTSDQRLRFLLEQIPLSGQRIEIYLADSGSFILQLHSAILVETNISWLEDSIISAKGKFLSSGRRIMKFLGINFQFPAGGFIDSQLLGKGCSSRFKISHLVVGCVAIASTH